MYRGCFRFVHRARSRSQRTRLYLSLLALFVLFLFVVIDQQDRLQQQLLSSAIKRSWVGGRSDGRSRQDEGQDEGQDGGQAKRVHTQETNGHAAVPVRRTFFNENGEEEQLDNKAEENNNQEADNTEPILHFLWCGGPDRKFEYRHYLALRRACAVIRPEKVVFHHSGLPRKDHEGYYTWFNQTLSETVNIVLQQLEINDLLVSPDGKGYVHDCSTEPTSQRFMLILRLLSEMGGVYIPEDSILIDFPTHLRTESFVSGATPTSSTHFREGLIVARKGGVQAPSSPSELLVVLASGRGEEVSLKPCGSVWHYDNEENADCICVRVEKEIFPADIWGGSESSLTLKLTDNDDKSLKSIVSLHEEAVNQDINAMSVIPTDRHLPGKWAGSNFLTLARLAGYGSRVVQARQGGGGEVPQIAHYICWECDIKFITYLSVLSTLYVAGLNKVYIHGIKQPSGVWWRRLQLTGRVIYVHREYPGKAVSSASLTSDVALGIMRVAILLKYGGVYCDNRVIWTNAIPDHLFSYETVASPGWHAYGAWPDSVSHSIILAKKNSTYLQKLRKLHAHNRKRSFWFVDQYLSYKILEEHPEVLLLHRHLQVACVNQNCHPTWRPGYQAEMYENPPGHPFSWQNETLSVLWDVFPSLSLETVKSSRGMIAEIALRVLNRAAVPLSLLSER